MTREEQPPLLARALLQELHEQMGTEATAAFVRNYISMWDSRYARLETACREGDTAAAMDVVLSIKTASHMAGAARLSALASTAQYHLGGYDVAAVAAMLGCFRSCGAETMLSLAARTGCA